MSSAPDAHSQQGLTSSDRSDARASRSGNGEGFASAAVAAAKQIAADQLGLHRLQAETLVDNEASQRVLIKNGFVRYGQAPEYLKIAGRWQEHRLFQVTFPDG